MTIVKNKLNDLTFFHKRQHRGKHQVIREALEGGKSVEEVAAIAGTELSHVKAILVAIERAKAVQNVS
jgi:hypothetical protein